MLLSLSPWPPRRRSNKTGSRTSPAPYLNDKQWLVIADLFPHKATGGRPRVHPRACLEGVLWVLISGARWKDFTRTIPQSCNVLEAIEGMDRVWRVPPGMDPFAVPA